MAFKKEEPKQDEQKTGPRPQSLKSATVDEQRRLLEEELTTQPLSGLEDMTEQEIVEIAALYRASTPIKIPNEKLDPTYEYRWLNRSIKNYRRRRGTGWKPVAKEMLQKLSKVPLDELHMGTHFDPDGYLCVGEDLVFAYIPKRIVEAIRKDHQRRSQAALGAGRKKFEDVGKLAGVETYDKSVG